MQFSIIIPTYNYGHFLPSALDSVLKQQNGSYEIVVIDDGSTDNTATLVKQYQALHPQKINYFWQKNQGVAVARNYGTENALGEYLLFLDADDKLLPDALSKFSDFLSTTKHADMVCGGHLSTNDAGKTRSHASVALTSERQRNFVCIVRKKIKFSIGTLIIRRSLFEIVKFPEKLRNWEDLVFLAQIVIVANCFSLPDPVVTIYRHQNSLRHNKMSWSGQSPEQITAALFDTGVVPASLQKMRTEFLSLCNLSQFGLFYEDGDYKKARKFYHKALQLYPYHFFKWRKLKRYLLSLFSK